MLPANAGNPCKQYKVVLLGDEGVGKSFLVKTLKYGCESCKDSREYKPTPVSYITNYCVPDTCQLYIVDTSGSPKFTPLVKQYLRHLDCAIFVFALDEPESLKGLEQWLGLFGLEFDGDATEVKKFVVGTQMDGESQLNKEVQDDAAFFAQNNDAEFYTISATNPTNLSEFFKRVGDALAGQNPCFQDSPSIYKPKEDCLDSTTNALLLNDALASPGVFMRYPDPLLIDTGNSVITNVSMGHQSLTMYGKDEELTWATDLEQRLQEPVLQVKPLPAINLDTPPVSPSNPLYSCVSSTNSASTWQHKNLSGDCVVGVTVKRQPTCTKFNDIKQMKFCSSKRDGSQREKGLFYMLMSTTFGKLLECGLNPAKEVPENNNASAIGGKFLLAPQPIDLSKTNNTSEIVSTSMSGTHAAVALSDGVVLTWGDLMGSKLAMPQQVRPLENKITQVACGIDFTVMLSDMGTVFSYGRGEFGQLGHGSEEDLAIATMIKSLSKIKKIAAGDHHAVAIGKQSLPVNKGVLYGWGLHKDDAKEKHVKTPRKYPKQHDITITSVSCGAHHTLCIAYGLIYESLPYSLGSGERGQLGYASVKPYEISCISYLYQSSKSIQAVSAGKNHSAFLTTKGEIFTCGCNQFGQLGYFTAEEDYSITPQKVDLGRNAANEEVRAKEVSCTEDCTMVLTECDKVLIWGKSFYGLKVDNPFPTDMEADRITDVTTCSVWCETDFTELVFALTEAPALLLCGVEKSNVDAHPLTAVAPCNVDNLVSITSVGSVLLAVDANGKMYFADSQTWCQKVLSTGSASLPTDFPRALGSAIRSLKCNSVAVPSFTWQERTWPDSVNRVKATLDTFFFTTIVGDVCSWKPFCRKSIDRHHELDDAIIVEISCGMQHAAVLTDEGVVLTCGNGSAGQLGHGTFESIWKFQPVPLTETLEATMVSCGSVSTAVLSRTGKVFFWGQPDLPEYEKNEMKIQILKTLMGTQIGTIDRNTAYVLQLDNEQDQNMAVVGKPFKFSIGPRKDGVISSTTRKVFRVEACSTTKNKPATRVKGKVKQDTKSTHKASILFLEEGSFQVIATIDDLHILGSPFTVKVEKGVLPSRCKVTLIGQNIGILQSVGDALQQQEARESFTNTGLKLEFWGVPGACKDQATCHLADLTSMTDRGLYVYVWDSRDGDLPKVDVKYWLQMLSMKAPQAEILLLGLNVSAGLANRLDLKPFQDINPNLKKTVLVGSEYQLELLKQIKEILEVKVHQSHEIVWYRAENLATKVKQKKDAQVETLDKKGLKSLALQCGIQSQYCFSMAVKYLEEAGLGLMTGQNDVFLILQEKWITRNLDELLGSCHHGALDSGSLAGPKKCIAELLINNQIAIANKDQTRIHIVYSLEPLHTEVWSPSDSTAFTAMRHLVFNVQPYALHTMFPDFIFKAVKAYPSVSIGKNAFVIHDSKYKSRVDCGPCFVDRRTSEVRVIVRAERPENCGKVADSILATLFEFDKLSQPFPSVKFSCSECLLQYIEQSDVSTAENQGELEVTCHGCRKNAKVKDLQKGYKETRVTPDLKWTAASSETGNPESPARPLLQPLVRYLDERLQHDKRLLSEIREGFNDIIKLTEESEEFTVPRTIFLQPEMKKSQTLFTAKLKSLLGSKQKWRLFLLCEGHGDGLGIHFLDIEDHKGYELNSPNEFILKHAGHLRLVLKFLLSLVEFGLGVAGLANMFPSQETLNNILGVLGLNVEILNRDWKKYLSKIDQFLQSIEETAKSSNEPKSLASNAGVPGQYSLRSRDYQHLQAILSDLVQKDNFGGMKREFRKGYGYVWVCKKHSKHPSEPQFKSVHVLESSDQQPLKKC